MALLKGGNGIVKTCTMIKKGKELNKNIGSKSLHHFIQRCSCHLPDSRSKPQVLMRSQQNCLMQEER